MAWMRGGAVPADLHTVSSRADMGIAEQLGAHFATQGRIEWIGLAAEKRAELVSVEVAEVREGTGFEGDHHGRSGRSKRQVSFIQAEALPLIATFAARDGVTPELLRRNVLVSGLNLRSIKAARFRIGDALFEGSGDCPPCSRMEKRIGPGGWNAMRGLGGITARVLEGGTLRVGDALVVLSRADDA
jgi:MOSC domain-containing protein YiiM